MFKTNEKKIGIKIKTTFICHVYLKNISVVTPMYVMTIRPAKKEMERAG